MKRKSQDKQKFTGQVPGTAKLAGQVPGAQVDDYNGHAMTANYDVSARLAASQELIDIDDFIAKYGATKQILDNHNDHISDTSQMSPEYFASVHTPVDIGGK